ncbi:WD repeat-containing protein [Drosera capensis]
MDLLCSANSNDSGDDERSTRPGNPQRKRPLRKPEYSTQDPYPIRVERRIPSQGVPRTGAPAPGRYVSKRERAIMASQNLFAAANQNPNLNPERSLYQPSHVLGDISDYDLPSHIRSLLRQPRKGYASAISTAQMVPQRPKGSHKACEYDTMVKKLVDVGKGIEIWVFKEEQAIAVIKFHPDNPNLFLSGGSRGLLKLWDIRTGTAVHEYVRSLGSILDLEFVADGKQFISSSDESGSRISENSLIVWDISRQIPSSIQPILALA